MLPSSSLREYTSFNRTMLRVSLLCIFALTGLHAGWQTRAEAQSTTETSPPSAAAEGVQSAPSLAHARDMVTRGRLEDAERELDALALQQPEPDGVERLRGFVAYQQNRLSEAEAAFAKAIQQNPADMESTEMRGVVLFRMGKPADAIPVLERAHAAVSSVNVDPNYVLAACYMTVGRYDDARHAFAMQYGFQPDSAPAYLITGRQLFRHELVQPASDAAHKALEIDPKLPLAHRLLGEIALAKGELPEAITELQKERDLNPLDGELYNRLGDAYIRSGQYHEAQQALDRAVLLEPNSTGPYILLGKVLLQQQDPVMAIMYLERAEHMDPANYMIHTLLAQAYRTADRKDDAAREFQTAAKLQSATTPKPDTQQ
jgi:predicted Zn-dependent protease